MHPKGKDDPPSPSELSQRVNELQSRLEAVEQMATEIRQELAQVSESLVTELAVAEAAARPEPEPQPAPVIPEEPVLVPPVAAEVSAAAAVSEADVVLMDHLHEPELPTEEPEGTPGEFFDSFEMPERESEQALVEEPLTPEALPEEPPIHEVEIEEPPAPISTASELSPPPELPSTPEVPLTEPAAEESARPSALEAAGESVAPDLVAAAAQEVSVETPPPLPSEPPMATETTSSARKRPKSGDLEMRIGSVWFNRIGLVAILISFALLGKYVNPHLAAWHKVVMSYLAAAVLSGLGWWFRERLKQFARPVMAGGIALTFFTSYAAHFVGPMRCVSLGVSLLLMSLSIGVLMACAERWRSEPTAGLAIFLGHVAAYVAGVDAFALVAILFLSAASLIFFLRQSWLPLSLLSVVAAYLSHLLWWQRSIAVRPPVESFSHDLLFLSSYYLIFLAADLIYHHRLWSRGVTEFTRAQQVAGRAVGPAALFLYATSTATIFRASGVYWERIYLFLIPFAVIQALLAYYHRRRDNLDYRLYASTAVVLISLGLISALGGLTLNLALAAEALLLLALARPLNMWFLTPLAQIVLAVNFIHFWLSDSHQIQTWPTFLGALATAAVYLVKSRLLETWRPLSEETTEGRVAVWMRQQMDLHAGKIAWLQVVAGCVLICYQCAAFFTTSWEGLALALLALPAAGLAIWMASPRLMAAALLLQTGSVILLGASSFVPTAEPQSWVPEQLALVVIALTGWVMLYLARRQRLSSLTSCAGNSLTLATIGAFAYCGHGLPQVTLFPLWAAVPLILWLESELRWGSWRGESPAADDRERTAQRQRSRLQQALPVIAAVVTARVVMQVFPSASSGLWALSLISVAVLAIALLRRSRELVIGLGSQLTLILAIHAIQAQALLEERMLSWWLVTLTVAAAVVLLLLGPRLRRGSFVLTGTLAVGLALAALCRLCLVDGIPFWPLSIWLLPVAGLWAAAERLSRLTFDDAGETQGWADLTGLRLLRGRTLGHALSIAWILAVVQTWILNRTLEDPLVLVLYPSLLALALLVAALLLRSSVLLLGAMVQLTLTVGTLIVQGAQLVEHELLCWWAIVECALASLALVTMARRQRPIRVKCPWTGAAIAALALTVAGSFGLILPGGHWFQPFWLWMVIPVVGWTVVELIPGRQDDHPGLTVWQWLASLLAAALSAVVLGFGVRNFLEAQDLLWFLAVLTPLLLVAALLRRSPALTAALVAHVALANVVPQTLQNLATSQLAVWGLITEAVVVAGALVFAGARARRGTMISGGVVSMAVAMLAIAVSILRLPSLTFASMSQWLIPVVGLWVVSELLGRKVPALVKSEAQDRFGLELMPASPGLLTVPPSLLISGLLMMVTGAHYSGAELLVPSMLYTVALAIATVLLRSPGLAAAALTLLTVSHIVVYGPLGASDAARECPTLALLLVSMTIGFGGGLEATTKRWKEIRGGGLSWYLYLLGFILGHVFINAYADAAMSSWWPSIPLQMALASVTMVASGLLRLRRLQMAALLSTTWVLIMVTMSFGATALRGDLLAIGLTVCLQLIVVERVCASQGWTLSESAQKLVHNGLVVLTGLIMLGALLLDSDVRGYWTSSGWSIVALVLVGLGFLLKDRIYRRVGLAVFVLTVVRVATVDVAQAQPIYRILAFMCLGACLVAVSFLYTRLKDQVSRWL